MFYNLFLPGGIGGDGYKVFVLNKRTGAGVKRLIWVVFLDRLTGMLALTLMALITGGFIREFDIYRYMGWILSITGLIAVAVMIRYFLAEFLPIMLKVAFYSLLVQLMQLVAVILILVSFGNYVNFLEYLLIFFVSSVVSVLPLTIGGAGAREITFLYGAKLLSLDPGVSVTLSLTFYLITVVTSLAGIYYVLRPMKIEVHSAAGTE